MQEILTLEEIVEAFTKCDSSSFLITAKDEETLLSAVDILFGHKVTNAAQVAILVRNTAKPCDGEVDSVTFWENRLGEEKRTEPLVDYLDSVRHGLKLLNEAAKVPEKKLWLSVGGVSDKVKYISGVWMEAKRNENGISFSVWRNKFGSSGVTLDE